MKSKPPKPQAQASSHREARLAAELRANLARRKAQARGRAEGDGEKPDVGSEDNKRQGS
jgi:hypothetical protein